MWSDRYYYLNIYADDYLSYSHDTNDLVAFLNTLPQLKQIGPYTFRNSNSLPYFVDLSLLAAHYLTSWSSNDTGPNTTLIAVVCAKDASADFELIKPVLVSIATYLNWQLVDEETDDGEENFILWQPRPL
jgi:hypothetical protein